jgi:hypothetical protein
MSIQSLPTTSSVNLAAVFEARCWARARLYSEGELELHEAVDKLQESADRDGLVAAIGQDQVQWMMSDAFGAVRERTNELATASAWEFGEAYDDHRGIVDGPTLGALLEALGNLIEQNDPARLQKWMALLTVAERRAVRALLVTA